MGIEFTICISSGKQKSIPHHGRTGSTFIPRFAEVHSGGDLPFARRGNPVLLTTHSPYILGQLNNQLFAGELESKTDGEEERKRLHAILPADVYLNPDETMAYHVINGVLNNAVDEGLIRNELIDGVSQVINREMDALIDISWDMEERHAAE